MAQLISKYYICSMRVYACIFMSRFIEASPMSNLNPTSRWMSIEQKPHAQQFEAKKQNKTSRFK